MSAKAARETQEEPISKYSLRTGIYLNGRTLAQLIEDSEITLQYCTHTTKQKQPKPQQSLVSWSLYSSQRRQERKKRYYTCMHMYMYLYMFVCSIWMCMCIQVYLYICIHMCVCVCLYVNCSGNSDENQGKNDGQGSQNWKGEVYFRRNICEGLFTKAMFLQRTGRAQSMWVLVEGCLSTSTKASRQSILSRDHFEIQYARKRVCEGNSGREWHLEGTKSTSVLVSCPVAGIQ